MDLVEPVADDPVATHREVDARRGEDRGVRARRGRQQAADREGKGARLAEQVPRGIHDGRARTGQLVGRGHGQQDNHHDRAHDGHEGHRPEHRPRQVAVGVLDLLGHARDLHESQAGHEHERGRRQDSTVALGRDLGDQRGGRVEQSGPGEDPGIATGVKTITVWRPPVSLAPI